MLSRFTRRAPLAVTLGLALSALASPPPARAQVGAVFLRVGAGARNAALGDADLVSSRDASVLHWNPAGLANFEGRQVLLLHNNWIADIRQEFIGVSLPWLGGSIGAAANGFYVGNIPRFEDDVPLDEPQGDFGYYAMSVQSSYGRRIVSGLSAGVTAKAIREQIDIDGGWSIAADIGLLYDTKLEGLSLGAAVANLGPAITVGGVSAELPLEGRGGIGYRRMLGRIGAGAYGMLRASKGLNPRGHLGLEAGLHGVFLRVGRKFGYDIEEGTYGLGFEVDRLRVDYAFVPFSEDLLGEAHRFSLALRP